MKYSIRDIDRSVFRAYDIRGVIGEQLDESAYYTIGRAIATRLFQLQRNHIYIARDGRLTSNGLADACIAGLIEGGIQVVDLGLAPTPVMYFATYTDDTIDSGIMITGSHNPANYNGIKMVLAGKTLVQEDIEWLYQLVVQRQFVEAKPASCIQRDRLMEYMTRITSDLRLARSLKVVVDCGNGVAGVIVPSVLQQLGCEVIPLYCDVDGRFPHHHPDPSVLENLVDLQQAVAHHQADIGLAFDGDGDRLGVVTDTGEVIWPDRIMMYYAQHLLAEAPGSTIVFDVKCSSQLTQVIEASGGVAHMCPTGHSIVKAVMKESKAELAGEMSGHLFFKHRWYGFDDALYSACRLLEWISQSEASVHQQFSLIPDSVNTPEIKIPIPDEHKFSFMRDFCENAAFSAAEIIRMDGLRVEFENGWGLVRASNTTPCLVARFEAIDEVHLQYIKDLFKQELQKLNTDLQLPF